MVMDLNVRHPFVACAAVSLFALASRPAVAGLSDLLGVLGTTKVEFTVRHAPTLPLKIKTVAIGQPEGRCAPELTSRLEEAFVAEHVTVIDREHLNQILAEHKLQVSALTDRTTATRVGQLLGAQALVFIKAAECTTRTRSDKAYTEKKTNRTMYNYVTEGSVNGTLRVVDLTRGTLLAAQRFEGEVGYQDDERYPDRQSVLDEAKSKAALSIRQLLVPWGDTRTLPFYDDSQCDLKTTFRLLKAHDLDGALLKAQENVADCRDKPGVKPTTVARAYYDLGAVQMMDRDYDAALENFTAADRIQTSKAFIEAMTEARNARTHAVQLAQYLAEAVPSARETPQPLPAATPTAASSGTSAAPASAASIEARLGVLEELLRKKKITQQEYAQKRAKILAEL